MKRTVLVYSSVLLPYSETFIIEQISSYHEWRGVLVGRRLAHEIDLNNTPAKLLENTETGWIGHLFYKAKRALGYPSALRELRKESPELIHVHFGNNAFDMLSIAEALNIPMLITLHGRDITVRREWWESGKGGLYMRSYPRRLLAIASRPDVHFIAVSNALRKSAIAFGIPAEKITTCYIGVDIRQFLPGPVPIVKRPRRVLFVGRLVEKKGCEYLIRAMQLAANAALGTELVIVGDGPLRSQLEGLATALRVNVQFLGRATSTRVKQELENTRILCLPSVTAHDGDTEGFGIVLLEAQAMGVPVITSAFGGAQEGILDGITGYTFCERDVKGLAEKLVTLLTNDQTATSMSRAARAFAVEHFDIQACTRMLEKQYNTLRAKSKSLGK